MSIPCEIAVKCVLPSVRAIIAKELTFKHGLKQTDAARLLGVSQPAISLYYRRIRGVSIDLEKDLEISSLIEDLTASLAAGNMHRKDFMVRFCEICRAIRAKGLLCKIHEAFDPAVDIEKCNMCLTNTSLRCT